MYPRWQMQKPIWMTCIITALYMLGSNASRAETLVLCTSPDQADVLLELHSKTFEGVSLSCISGDFIADMTPCAPENGYGLSAPTGSAGLVGIASNWRDYADHSGGVVSFFASPSAYSFAGGVIDPKSGYQEAWRFEANRLSGDGSLSIVQKAETDGAAGRSLFDYTCEAAHQKF